MRFSRGAKKALYLGVATLAAVLVFKQPLIERVYAQKQQSAQIKLSPKEKKKLIKNFEKAVKKGDVKKAAELFDQSDVIGEKELTNALMTASKRGNLEMVRFLVEEGADVNAFDMDSYKTRETGWTPLVHAAVHDRLEVVKYFVEELGIDVDQPDLAGCTPLMNTAFFRKKNYKDNYAMIEYLISQGADVNATAKNGTTAFMGTAIEGRIEVATILIQNGAKVNVRTTDYGDTALYRAVEKDKFDFVECLLSVGADIDVQDDFKVTPLMKAAGNGSITSVKMLVAKGADVNLQDDVGRTALIYAVRMADLKVKELTEEELEGMRVPEKNLYEMKQQYRKESIEIIKILLSSPYLNVNAKDKSGKTVLDHTDDDEIRKILKKHGAK